MVIHFAWILFMLVGSMLTLCGFLHKEFFDRWLFRNLHLLGIAYVSILAMMGKYYPLTIWENTLRAKYDPTLTYSGSFMIHYFEKFVYPDVNPLIIQIPITFIGVFILRPPKKIKRIFIKRCF